jgi:hypothetical protein
MIASLPQTDEVSYRCGTGINHWNFHKKVFFINIIVFIEICFIQF